MIGRRLARIARALRAGWGDPPATPIDREIDHDDSGVDIDRGMPDYSTRERGWMQTVTGRRFYPLDPKPEDVDVYDVAHGLAMCCRYAGHALRFYSVAEHCIHVSREVERRMRSVEERAERYDEATILHWSLLALLHDSSEAYIGDMIRPLKHQPEMAEFRAAETMIENAVLRALGSDVPDKLGAWRLIREIDNRIIADEIRVLKTDVEMYRDITVEPLGVRIECYGPEWARERFLLRYNGLKLALEATS